MDQKDIRSNFENNMLTVTGASPGRGEEGRDLPPPRVLLRELHPQLHPAPTVDMGKIDAKYRNGVLEIR